MTESKKCLECGTELSIDAPSGICPKCLLQVGLVESATDATSASDAHTSSTDQAVSAEALTVPPASAESVKSGNVPPIGTKLRYFGDYELLEEIARGGMGVVYKARQTSLNRIVALKMILAGLLAGEADVQRFHTEAEAAAQLDHPGIVPIFEVGEFEEQHYFSMGLVEGKNLAQKVSTGPFPPQEAAELTKQVAVAIDYAHTQGVIHRDLKPANILLDKDVQPRVTDFGLAKKVDADSGLTATGQILGTPSYMAPEQAGGESEKIGPLSDVYSLGAILYCLLTGRPPFQSASPTETLIQVLQQEPVSPRLLISKIPRDLETISMKCLEKDRRRRYESAGELADELDRYIKGEPIKARPISRPVRAWRWCRRKPVVATLSVMLMLTILSVAIVASVGYLAAAHERNIANRNLYVSRVYLAHRAWESADLAQVKKVLDEYDDDSEQRHLRGWEWFYLRSLSHREEVKIGGQGISPRFAVWSRDGQRLAITGHNSFSILDASTGRISLSLLGKSDITAAVWGPDKRLVSASGNGSIKIWNAVTGKSLFKFHEPSGAVSAIDWSPNGKRVATAGKDSIRIWNPDNGEEIRSWKSNQPQIATSLSFSPNGDWLASIHTSLHRDSKNGIVIWAENTGKQVATFEHNGYSAVTWSPDGQKIAAAVRSGLFEGEHPVQIKVWNVESKEEVLSFPTHDREVLTLDWSPDGRWLATGSRDSTIGIFDAGTGERKSVLRGHTSFVNKVLWRPDGKRITSVGFDNTIRIWNPITATDAVELRGHYGLVEAIDWDPDGERLISLGQNDRALLVWEPSHGKKVNHFGGELVEVHNRDGTKKQAPAVHDGIATDAAWSSNGSYVASTGWDKTVKVWEVKSGKNLITLSKHTDRVNVVDWNPLDNRLASGSRDGTVRVWSLPEGRQTLVLQAPTGPLEYNDEKGNKVTMRGRKDWNDVVSLAWSFDGRLLAGGTRNGKVRVWDASNGNELYTLSGHRTFVTALAWNPDTSLLAAASEGSHLTGEIIVWNMNRRQQVHTLKGHGSYIHAITWHPGGNRIASADREGEIKIWDPQTGQETLALRSHRAGIADLEWSPDGRQLASASKDGSIRVWNASMGYFSAWYDRTSPQPKSHRFSLSHVFGNRRSGMPRFAGKTNGNRGRYTDAANNFLYANELGAEDGEIWYHLALVQLADEDVSGYQKTCQRMLDRHGATQQPCIAQGQAWICALGKESLIDYSPAVRLARSALKDDPENAIHLGTLGALLFRDGQYREALEKLNEAIQKDKSGCTLSHQLFLTMTLSKLERREEAEEQVQKLTDLIGQLGPVVVEMGQSRNACPWDLRLELDLLLQEAKKGILLE